MLFSSRRPSLARPARSDDSDVPILLILFLGLLLVGLIGGGFVLFTWRRAQAQREMAVEMEMMARQDAEEARAQAERLAAQAPQQANAPPAVARQAALLIAEKAQTLCEKGNVNEGLLWLARGAEVTKDDAEWRSFFVANLAAWGRPPAEPRVLFRQAGPVTALAAGPDGKTFLAGDEKGAARVYDGTTGKPVGEPIEVKGGVTALAFGPDGKTARVADDGGHWLRVEIATRKPDGDAAEAPGPVLAVSFKPDGTGVAVGLCERGAWFTDGEERENLKPVTKDSPLLSAALAPDGKRFLGGHEDGRARLWSLPDAKPLGPPLREGAPVRAVAVSADGRLFATAAAKSVRLWDAVARRPVGRPPRQEHDVLCLAFTPDGASLLTGGADGAARLWPLPRTEGLSVERLALWAQVTAGAELDQDGAVKPLTPSAHEERRRRLAELGGPPRP